MQFRSKVLVGLVEAHCFCSVDYEVACVDIVALHDHFEDFRLMYLTFLHEVNDLVLNCDRVVRIVIQLSLQLIFELTVLLEE